MSVSTNNAIRTLELVEDAQSLTSPSPHSPRPGNVSRKHYGAACPELWPSSTVEEAWRCRRLRS